MTIATDDLSEAAPASGTFLGIDFSGNAAQWSPHCRRPTVWIAVVRDTEDGRQLVDLRPVQALPGTGDPFARLVALLRAGSFAAAGIDAPFSIPARYLPPGGHPELLRRVALLPIAAGRPFAQGCQLLDLAFGGGPPPDPPKPYRDTEIGRGVNTRSTLWNGPRGGAPFTVACLTLLARADRPVWPWRAGPGMLVEAFPAAQLRVWGLPHAGYGRPEQREVRARIVDGLAARLRFDAGQRALMLECPDALDATLAAFGAIAAARSGAIADPPPDGRIAMLDADAAAGNAA